jgi:glycosyltransferase involved in cell wall biosynthesis
MAGAIQRLLTEPGLAERLSRSARAKAEGFDWDAILPRWIDVFIQVSRQR